MPVVTRRSSRHPSTVANPPASATAVDDPAPAVVTAAPAPSASVVPPPPTAPSAASAVPPTTTTPTVANAAEDDPLPFEPVQLNSVEEAAAHRLLDFRAEPEPPVRTVADEEALCLLDALETAPVTNENVTSPSGTPTPSFDALFRAHQAFVANNRPTEAARLAQGSSNCSEGYCNKKRKIIRDFLEGLERVAPKYNHLLVTTTDVPPTFFVPPGSAHALLFLALCGPSDKKRKTMILSDMLVDWIGGLRRKRSHKGSFYHAPSTLNVMTRNFLAATKEYYDWHFTMSDFKYDGGYAGFFKRLCDMRQKEDVSEICFF